ncbi:MAG: hypothetical protein K9K76_10790 [Halanaerobiales bacterium]|nr:hypothetical protein [Halanaerobiales bacterium]
MITIRKKLIYIIIVMILLLPIAVNVNAQELYPPKEYDQLLKDYKDMYDIAQKYKKLYEEAERDVTEYKKLYQQEKADKQKYRDLYKSAEQDNKNLIKSNNRLQDLIDTQRGMINDLINKKEIGVITGVNITPANPENSGVILGFDFKF